MHYKVSWQRRLFIIFNYCFIGFTCILCLYPVLNTFAISLSGKAAVEAGLVGLIPVDFQLNAYQNILKDQAFFRAFGKSIIRVILGVSVQMIMTVLAAYPLSMTKKQFPKRDLFMWYFVFTMMFSGGMIPTYLVVMKTGLLNNIWALILPGAVPVYNVILMLNYIKGLPDAIYESAKIDGAGEWRILGQMILPLSKPILATLVVFTTVGHWNAWFDGMLYMSREKYYPLQTYLRTIVVNIQSENIIDASMLENLSTRNNKAAQIFVAMVPILCIYPFLQKYFTTGIVLGSVKG